jgi:hypothetical protein
MFDSFYLEQWGIFLNFVGHAVGALVKLSMFILQECLEMQQL